MDMMSSVSSSSVMSNENASLNASSSMLMALDMLAEKSPMALVRAVAMDCCICAESAVIVRVM